MSLTSKDRQIAFLNATNAAATLLAGTEFDPQQFDSVRDMIYDSTEVKIAEFVLGDAFPGAQPAGPAPLTSVPNTGPGPVAPVPVASGPSPAPAPGPFPSASTGGGDAKDALWNELFADASKFYDNRADKAAGRSPSGPDFKRKSDGKGLWLSGKWPAPQWVLDRLAG